MEEKIKINVRYAEKADLGEVNRLRMQVSSLHSAARPDIFRADICDEMEAIVYRKYESEAADVIVAQTNNEICGFAVIEYVSVPVTPYTVSYSYCHIDEFGVDEAHRRKGIAACMIEFIKEEAGKRGLQRIDLDVWDFNKGAVDFYENAGFSAYKRSMEISID